MSLNNIQLNSYLIADLYTNALVDQSASHVPASPRLRYLGDFQKKMLIIVENRNVPYLDDEELNFLVNVLSACKRSLADVAIVNFASRTEEELQQFITEHQPEQVLLFGLPPLSIGLPINFPHFQLQQFNNRTYLYAPALREYEQDKSLKSNLWKCLKNLLGL